MPTFLEPRMLVLLESMSRSAPRLRLVSAIQLPAFPKEGSIQADRTTVLLIIGVVVSYSINKSIHNDI
jgi:hypothetical protein